MSLSRQAKLWESMRLSPLFVDTEFVPSGMSYFTLYNRRISSIPSVLPYSSSQRQTNLQAKTSGKKVSNGFAGLKESLLPNRRRKPQGEELQMDTQGQLMEPKKGDQQSKEKCDICCIMLASKEEVFRLSVRRMSQQKITASILGELCRRYDMKLSEDDVQFNIITFSCEAEAGLTNIRYRPNPVDNLTDHIMSNQLTYIGIDIITNRFSPTKFAGKGNKHVVSTINIDTNKLLRICLSKEESFMLEYERVKQYQVRELLGMLGVKNAQSKGLRIMDKIYEPTDIIYLISFLYEENALINFVEAGVVWEGEVFLEGIDKCSELNTFELGKLIEEDSTQKSPLRSNSNKLPTNPLGLFCSECQIHSGKQASFNLLYHIINRYIRNYFTHVNNFFDDSISRRFVSSLYKQIRRLPVFEGEVYRKVGFELSCVKGDIVEFNIFLVTTRDQKLVELHSQLLYETRPTIVKIISKTGREAWKQSNFDKLQEVIFQPFTRFKVTERIESSSAIKLTLQETNSEVSAAEFSHVLWVDNKSEQGRSLFQSIQCLPKSIFLYQLQSSFQLSQWIEKHSNIIQSKRCNVIMITNMSRVQNGIKNANAGIDAINISKVLLPHSKIILYIGNLQIAIANLIKNKLNPEELMITNEYEQLLGWLIQEFNATSRKMQKQKEVVVREAPKDKFQKQDWQEYFSVIHEQPQPKKMKSPAKEQPAQQILVPSKTGISIVSSKPQQQKAEHLLISQNGKNSPILQKATSDKQLHQMKESLKIQPEQSPKVTNLMDKFNVENAPQQYFKKASFQPKSIILSPAEDVPFQVQQEADPLKKQSPIPKSQIESK